MDAAQEAAARALYALNFPGIPVKKALKFMGKNVGPLRAPLSEMEEAHAAKLKQAMVDFGISMTE